MLNSINRGAAYFAASIIGFLGTIGFLMSGALIGLAFIVVGPTLVILVHELGHAFAAWRLGMNVQTIAVGPVMLRTQPLRLALTDRVLGYDVGGYVLFQETASRYLTRRTDALITLAGPLANLAAAVASYAAGYLLRDDSRVAGGLLIGFAFTSLSAFVISAWPFKMASGRANDALQFFRIIRHSVPQKRSAGPPTRSPWQAP